MTEFWESKKQYWCKFCSIFIRDDAPSRSLHENGLKHQGNKERALRQLYKTGEHAKRDKEHERRMMERIERDALSAHRAAGGVGPVPSSSTSAGSSSSSKPASSAARAKPTDPYANYSTAASLGYADADAAWAAERAAEREKRMQQGFVGGWETIAIAPPVEEAAAGADGLDADADPDAKPGEASTNATIPADSDAARTTLRALKGTLDEPDSAEAHAFRFGADTHARRLPDDDLADDLDALEARIRERARREAAAAQVPAPYVSGGFVKAEDGAGGVEDAGEAAVKAEPGEAQPEAKPAAEAEDVKPASAGIFKKRRAPGGANRSVRQKV